MYFENLKSLLSDMRKKQWRIDSWFFSYNNIDCIVLLELYVENDKKPSEKALAKITFYKNGATERLDAYIDWWEVHFHTATAFYDFFNIDTNNGYGGRALFQSFSECFAQYIPESKIIRKNEHQTHLIITQLNKTSGDGEFCFAIKRNPPKKDGSLGQRSLANRNKAELLRPDLFEKYKGDKNISFCFSEKPEKEKTDHEIMENFAKNQGVF